MSWKGVPKKENYFPLFAEDWNLLVDAVDELYYMLQTLPAGAAGLLVGGYLYGDLLPAVDSAYSLGSPDLQFLNVYARNVFADGKPVLKDGDPVYVADLLPQAQDTLKSVIAGTPVSAYVSDLLPQAQNTLKNVLINSVLARDLWETVPLLIQFDAGDGVLQVYAPPVAYRTMVRGWYAVSTATGGLAQLRGAVSLTPVALIPLSVPSVSVPNIFLRLYYDEPLLLYYSGATLGSYLQVLLNVLMEWTGVSLLDPSCISPLDPLWTPPDGWTYLYRFASADEVGQAFNFPSGYEVVENGVLGWNPPSGETGGVERSYGDRSWKKVAVCLKVKVSSVAADYSDVIYFNPNIAPDSGVSVEFNVVAGRTSLDIMGYEFTPPDDWIVIVVENYPEQPAYLRIYDRNKNLLFQLQLTKFATSVTAEEMWFEVHNNTSYGTWDIQIDWIALKY
jgi:hypothetical protein